ncbi:MAG: phosphate transporter permease [Acidimicrobiaceae bacterium]|nr:phosphate transporter permease [Acidimicrobiaceae bacterium]
MAFPTEPADGEVTGADTPPRSSSGAATPHTAGVGAGVVLIRHDGVSPRRAQMRRLATRLLDGGTGLTAVIPFLGLAAMVVVLIVEAIPAIRFNGWGFLTSSTWSVGSLYGNAVKTGGVTHLAGAHYGAWPLIAGTLESSAIAIVVALPLAVGAAVIVVEKLPRAFGGVVGLCLELLAGVPSVVIGLFGIFTFGPWLAKHIYPTLSHMPNVPVLNVFRGNFNSNGEGLLTAGLVLAAMIIPIIAATTRDLLRQVPETTKEGAQALGMTHAEAFFNVQSRWVRTGVVGAAVLGLGRALGETIAVAIIAGGAGQSYLAGNIYGAMSTIAANIVSLLDSAQTDPTGLAVKSLAEAALVLLVITLLVNIAARVIVRRSSRGAALPVGAGF